MATNRRGVKTKETQLCRPSKPTSGLGTVHRHHCKRFDAQDEPLTKLENPASTGLHMIKARPELCKTLACTSNPCRKMLPKPVTWKSFGMQHDTHPILSKWSLAIGSPSQADVRLAGTYKDIWHIIRLLHS